MANVITDLRGGTRSFKVYPSAARTTTPDTQEFENYGRVRGLIVVINATAATATPSLTVKVEGVDRVSGATWTIVQAAAITGVTATPTVVRVNPCFHEVVGVKASDLVPEVFRVTATHGNADSITYSVSAHLTY